MQTLIQTHNIGTESGTPLPVVFKTLEQHKVIPRRGQVTMVAGPPNAGKSAFTLDAAIRMRIPTLYISADTDQHTTLLRSIASTTGQTMYQVELALHSDRADLYLGYVRQLQHLHFMFEPSPTVEDIDLELEAFAEKFGEYPHLLVVDNLMNVRGETGNEWQDLKDSMRALHHLARMTGAAVFVLHHTSEQPEFSQLGCSPMRSIQGKVSQLPELILTVFRHEDRFGVCAVKNRNGPADRSGKNAVWLYVKMDAMQFSETPFLRVPTNFYEGWEE